MTAPLSPNLATSVLSFLGNSAAEPSIPALASLVRAYTERVPWESASRILRRAAVTETADCPRWPETFWAEAMTLGHGGTCFESNYAFFSLLRALGYEGYLTVNDMGDTCGCHTAIVLTNLIGGCWLADVGMPLYSPIPLDGMAHPPNPFHRYTLQPVAGGFDVLRDNHPQPCAFTLRDQPVSDRDYRVAVTADYGEGGLFLDRLILLKVVDGRVWRFDQTAGQRALQWFEDGIACPAPLPDDPARALADRFAFDEATLREALNRV